MSHEHPYNAQLARARRPPPMQQYGAPAELWCECGRHRRDSTHKRCPVCVDEAKKSAEKEAS